MTSFNKKVIFKYRNVILMSLTVCYIIQYIDRITINTLIPFISRDLGMAARQIGLGSAIMMLFYGPSQWATGWLCDRIGSKKVLIFSVIAWSILTGWMSEVRSITEWYIRMGIFGILVGTEFVPSARLIVRWFPPRIRARAQSIFSWAWIVTPAWAPLVATLIYTGLGNQWRPVFLILASMGIIPLLIMIFLVYERPERCKYSDKNEIKEAYEDELTGGLITETDLNSLNLKHLEKKSKKGKIPFNQILTTKGYIPIVIIYVMAQQMFWGVVVWSAQYLSQVHRFSVIKMGAWACVYFIGGALGSFLSGLISDRFLGGRRKPMIFLSFGCAIPFIIALATIKIGVSPAILLLILTGTGFFSNMIWGPALTIPADLFSAEVYGKAIGFTNCCGYMVAAACPYIMGACIKTDPVTHVVNYFWSWIYIAFIALMGIVAAFFLVDTRTKNVNVAL
jgi:sugar phosphate permease